MLCTWLADGLLCGRSEDWSTIFCCGLQEFYNTPKCCYHKTEKKNYSRNMFHTPDKCDEIPRLQWSATLVPKKNNYSRYLNKPLVHSVPLRIASFVCRSGRILMRGGGIISRVLRRSLERVFGAKCTITDRPDRLLEINRQQIIGQYIWHRSMSFLYTNSRSKQIWAWITKF